MEKKPHVLILIAEDDKFLVKVYQTKLTKEGFQVEIANNGEEALKKAKANTPDLIFCDLMMPIMDGFETLKALKEDPKLKKVKVVILSNLSQEEDRKRVLDLGAEEYLVKADVPFSEVINLAKKYLNKK